MALPSAASSLCGRNLSAQCHSTEIKFTAHSEFHAFEANALCGIGLGRRLGTVWLARRDWGALAGGKCEVR